MQNQGMKAEHQALPRAPAPPDPGLLHLGSAGALGGAATAPRHASRRAPWEGERVADCLVRVPESGWAGQSSSGTQEGWTTAPSRQGIRAAPGTVGRGPRVMNRGGRLTFQGDLRCGVTASPRVPQPDVEAPQRWPWP